MWRIEWECLAFNVWSFPLEVDDIFISLKTVDEFEREKKSRSCWNYIRHGITSSFSLYRFKMKKRAAFYRFANLMLDCLLKCLCSAVVCAAVCAADCETACSTFGRLTALCNYADRLTCTLTCTLNFRELTSLTLESLSGFKHTLQRVLVAVITATIVVRTSKIISHFWIGFRQLDSTIWITAAWQSGSFFLVEERFLVQSLFSRSNEP